MRANMASMAASATRRRTGDGLVMVDLTLTNIATHLRLEEDLKQQINSAQSAQNGVTCGNIYSLHAPAD